VPDDKLPLGARWLAAAVAVVVPALRVGVDRDSSGEDQAQRQQECGTA
jgi:hypothetical protein